MIEIVSVVGTKWWYSTNTVPPFSTVRILQEFLDLATFNGIIDSSNGIVVGYAEYYGTAVPE